MHKTDSGECSRTEALYRLLAQGSELDDTELRHLEECPDCGAIADLHDRLSDLEAPEPRPEDLEALRRRVSRELAAPGRRAARRPAWGGALAWFARPAWAAVAAALLLSLGFTLGRRMPAPPGPGVAGPSPAPEAQLAATGIESQLDLAARAYRDLSESRLSPYVYSDLEVVELEGDMVRLSFDVATHVELERLRTDPLVTEVLVQSIVNREPLDSRLTAVEEVPVLTDKVRDALVLALTEDPDLAVRLKAMERLTATGGRDAPVTEALLGVLEREESVHLRLLAIDALTERGVEPGALAGAVERGLPEPGTAIRSRLGNYLANHEVATTATQGDL